MSLAGTDTAAWDGDQPWLIYGYVFSSDGVGRNVNVSSAAQWLSDREENTDEFIWLHFNGAYAVSKNWLQTHIELPDEFYDVLKEQSRSTRIEQVHNGLLAVVNDVVYDLLGDTNLQVATLFLVVGPRFMVSVRHHPMRSVDRLRAAVNAREHFVGPLDLLIHLFRDQADVLAQITRSATEKVDLIEDTFLDEKLPNRTYLGNLRRDLVRLQRLLAPEPGSLFRLLNRPPRWVGIAETQELRQSSEEFSLVLRDMAGLQERIKLLQEEIVAIIGERTNRSVFVLTAVTVIALPINLTAGLFGMNVGGIPFNQSTTGFWFVVGGLVFVTLLVTWLIFRLREH